MSKTLSVITVCYNIKDEIERTCESIVNQTWQDFEWIVVDGGSTDGTVDILNKYKDRIDVLISEPDSGIYNAMNKGIKRAKGKWLNFMNGGDCFADHEVLEKVFNNKDYDADVLYGDTNIVKCNGDKFSKKFKQKVDKLYFVYDWLCHQSCFINKSLFQKYGLYNENLKIVSDWEKWIQFAADNRYFLYLDILISDYYLGGISDNIMLNSSHRNEREYVISKYFSTDEIKQVNGCNAKYKCKVLYKLFSVLRVCSFLKSFKNILYGNGCVKKETLCKLKICGIPLLLSKRTDVLNSSGNENIDNFLGHYVRHNTVLMVEMNNCHGECLPGLAKYFLDLGYYVEILLSKSEYELEPLKYLSNPKLSIFPVSIEVCQRILQLNMINQYSYVYFNSDFCYPKAKDTRDLFVKNMKLPKNKVLMLSHHPEKWYTYGFNNKFKGILLANFFALGVGHNMVVNSHYFCDFQRTKKNKKTRFIVVGNIESNRKNHSVLIDAVSELVKNNIVNFEITIVARRGNVVIPQNLQPYFNFKGRLNYPDMYEECKKADFFLPLLDPENKDHNRYLTSGTSGSYQLIYGFKLPAIIAYKFMNPINLFSEENALTYYANNELATVMEKAINMTDKEYNQKVTNIAKLAHEIYDISLQNLKKILE